MQYNKKLSTIALFILLLFPVSAMAATISTDAKLQYNKGVDYYKLGQLEDAVTCFKSAIDLDPNYIDAYYNLGTLLEYLNQKEAALSVFKQIILRKPDDYESVYKAAKISFDIGENEKSRMYLALIPNDSMVNLKAKDLLNKLPQNTVLPEAEPQTQSDTFPEVSSPTGIVSDNDGNLYVAGYSDNTIYKIGTDNKKIVYIKDSKINGPIGLAMDKNNNLYIANYNNNNVLKADILGNLTIFMNDVKKPYCMNISNGYLYVSAQGNNSIEKRKL